jgi:hypothetical protein
MNVGLVRQTERDANGGSYPRRGYCLTAGGRLALVQAIHETQPWLKATGPKTAAGKARTAQNAVKHGRRARQAIAGRKRVTSLLRFLIASNQWWLALLTVAEALDAVANPLDGPVNDWTRFFGALRRTQETSRHLQKAICFVLKWVDLNRGERAILNNLLNALRCPGC